MRNKFTCKVKRVSMGHYVAFKKRGNYWIYANGTTIPRVEHTLTETLKTMKRLNAICNPHRTFKPILTVKEVQNNA